MAVKIMRMPLQLEVAKKHAARVPAIRRYDRDSAMRHAKWFWNKQCCDGYVAIHKRGAPPYREAEPAREFENPGIRDTEIGHETNGKPIPWNDLDDCSHFTSCCIGRPYDAAKLRPMLKQNPHLKREDAPRVEAGGLNVKTVEDLGAPWLYGIVGAPKLVAWLSQPHIGTVLARQLSVFDAKLDAAVRQLQAADVIALSGPHGYSHVLVYDGKGHVYCHTRCRDGEDWRVDMTAQYTIIRIHDEIQDRP